jgi:hypothetical protein
MPVDIDDIVGVLFFGIAVLTVVGILIYGFERVLVAGEAFFLFCGFAILQTRSVFRRLDAEGVEGYLSWLVMGFGLCAGLLAAYLLLTTAEGQAITDWVTAQTLRIVGSMFTTAFGLVVLQWVADRLRR